MGIHRLDRAFNRDALVARLLEAQRVAWVAVVRNVGEGEATLHVRVRVGMRDGRYRLVNGLSDLQPDPHSWDRVSVRIQYDTLGTERVIVDRVGAADREHQTHQQREGPRSPSPSRHASF